MKHQFKVFLWAFWSILFLTLDMQGQLLSPEMGTIIVTYQTDQAGQRLDRIRFWLVNDQQKRTLYPKKDEFVSNSHTPNERTVVITHLPPGNYRIEFLIPNTDQFFEEVPPREAILTPGAAVKIDQTIRLHSLAFLASLTKDSEKSKEIQEVSTKELEESKEEPETLKKGVEELKEESRKSKEFALVIIKQENPIFPFGAPLPPPFPLPGPYTSFPTPVSLANFSLTSNQTTGWKLMQQGRLVYSGVDSASNISIPPGRDYYIIAEDVPGYSFYTAPKTPFGVAQAKI